MKAIVDEAHRLGRRVAAHAMGREGIEASLKVGVDSIEHGFGLDAEMMDRMVRQGTYWCPTIYVGAYVAEGRAAAGAPIWLTPYRQSSPQRLSPLLCSTGKTIWGLSKSGSLLTSLP